jgi:hypothetical protein
MKKTKMKATTLRRTMTVLIIFVIIGSAIGFYFAQKQLKNYAITVGGVVSESTAGGTNTAGIKKLQEEIAEFQTSAEKANSITTSTQDYQNQAIQDLNKYAANSGISITDYNFAQPTTKSVGPAGVGLGYITITLNNPIPFNNFLQFLISIENNIPKMQITGVDLSRDSSSTDAITVRPLTVEVYTR